MAKLHALPELSIISGFKRSIDYYIHRGIPCARKWPTHRPRIRSPQELATTTAFTQATQLYTSLAPEVIAGYQAIAEGTPLTARDLFMRSYMTGLFQPPPHS